MYNDKMYLKCIKLNKIFFTYLQVIKYLLCVIYKVKVVSLSWYADSCTPYNTFINVYMTIYI